LAGRDRRRVEWLQQVDRSLALIGAQPDLRRVPDEALRAFTTTYNQLETIRRERRIPQVIAAIPTIGKAAQLGLSHEELELRVMPALLVDPAVLVAASERVQSTLATAKTITITSGPGYELRLERGERPWLRDAGRLETTGGTAGAIVSNVPAGLLYTTIVEESAEGDLFLPVAGPARELEAGPYERFLPAVDQVPWLGEEAAQLVAVEQDVRPGGQISADRDQPGRFAGERLQGDRSQVAVHESRGGDSHVPAAGPGPD
ncbi:MAG: hypothetical protein QXT45_07885, partial [Candidatus Bilamarchaeaceae archaeon]